MPCDCVSYQDSGYFSPLMNDYLDQKEHLKPLYNRFPTLENFEAQIVEKQSNFDNHSRTTLVSVLNSQYKGLKISTPTQNHIDSLLQSNTFTITTGHQLNLFTGPLYFLYKIISTINLTRELKLKYPDYNFVPMYWMATEDHDFDEINHFVLHGKKFRWNKEVSGPVGRLSTDGIEEVYHVLARELGSGTHAGQLKKWFEEAYLTADNLADATRHLANGIFGDAGLVILDADHHELKKMLIPVAKAELLEQISHKKLHETAKRLEPYGLQVNPREINLFYIEDGIRERIILQNDTFHINNTTRQFTASEILTELENHPEKFSPNVVIRPLYQEIILPNLCYIGGGGELAYWLELKAYFDAVGVVFPILLLRNSVLLATAKQVAKADKLQLSWKDLFMKQNDLIHDKVRTFSALALDFTPQKSFLIEQFRLLEETVNNTHPSFAGAVNAQTRKQLKGLENLEKRLLKAEKKQHAMALQRLSALQNELFPGQGLQERKVNFSEFYLEYGDLLLRKLFTQLHPLSQEFTVVILNDSMQ